MGLVAKRSRVADREQVLRHALLEEQKLLLTYVIPAGDPKAGEVLQRALTTAHQIDECDKKENR